MLREKIVQVALGKIPADTVIINGTLVNVHTRECYPADISLAGEYIAGVGSLPVGAVGPKTQIIDAQGKYLVPGFIDAHIHFESSMLTYTEFVNTVLPLGTTCVASDLMEVTIVSGLEGLKAVLAESRSLPVTLKYPVPSFMGDESEFQTTGSVLRHQMIEELLALDEAVGLAEVLVPPILAGSKESASVLALAEKLGKTAEGHAPAMMGSALHAYASTGIRSDHESTTKEEALEKLRCGLRVLMREGSASTDLQACLKTIVEEGIDPRHCAMVSDDIDALHLYTYGHMDHKIRMAIEAGVDPVVAIQMATLNPAESLKIDDYHGSIAPGKYADVVLLSSLEKCTVDAVVAKGKLLVEQGKLTHRYVAPDYDPVLLNTVQLKQPLTTSDLLIAAPSGAHKADVHVIGSSPVSLLTEARTATLDIVDGTIASDPSRDILHIACVERYGKNGNIGRSFIQGFGLSRGAIATSVGHDHHNITVIGAHAEDMLVAVNRVVELNGAIVVVDDGKVVGELALPVAGLLSQLSGTEAAQVQQQLLEQLSALGCEMPSPFMTLSFITLIFIPDFGITDVGLMDVKKFAIVPPVVTWQ
jgi:adenine deaminase